MLDQAKVTDTAGTAIDLDELVPQPEVVEADDVDRDGRRRAEDVDEAADEAADAKA